MAKYTRLEVLNTIISEGFVPLFYNTDVEIVKKVIKACYDGGGRIFEFTNRGDFAHEVFSEINKWVSKECPGLIIGVGSVVDSATTSLYIQLGANFIVSPLLNNDMAKICNRRKITWIPGCATLSEINSAEEVGAEIVKIFPAKEIGGPDFVKAIKSPCPWINIMASGGVTTEHDNIKAWFDAGVTCIGMGSGLFKKELIKEQNFGELSRKVSEVLEIIKNVRN
ncbi:MAG: bifunctional 4-hydroxy-2-oxoglutarate aldolase/2-dehydro-3-deoxy-phosphogluconate aldolase [Bacteroidales bacterium]|nr:bifunctional 4-hydroxy-2-oxoglutarate aldolase/2-dehydro-3-deoxy-phosphogluconate aldolase [Bacteroidales bacterium]